LSFLIRSGPNCVPCRKKEHEQIYAKPGWVEHDPDEIWRRTQEVIAEAMQQRGFRPKDLAAIGITNQRETTVALESQDGTTRAQLPWVVARYAY